METKKTIHHKRANAQDKTMMSERAKLCKKTNDGKRIISRKKSKKAN